MTDAIAPNLQTSLGQIRIVSCEDGKAVIEYEVGDHMCHSGGVAQGGFVCGWIDAAMAHASLSVSPEMTPMSLEMKVTYFARAHDLLRGGAPARSRIGQDGPGGIE